MNRIIVILVSLLAMGMIRAQQITAPNNDAFILTPEAPLCPQINCAKVYGARPGSAFQFLAATSGQRPMQFRAEGLPKGLKMDVETGLITGCVKKAGEYAVKISAQNEYGSDYRVVRIKIGDKIALTPPMGWNSWNCWGKTVSQEKVMASARAMIDKGLINYGWSYINIDDGWQGIRGGRYNAIMPNKRFPDMKGLSDFIHGHGLKMGIYSSAWVGTFGGHIGSTCPNEDGTYPWITAGRHNDIYRISDSTDIDGDRISWANHYYGEYSFTDNDAKQWADWQVDYLKYDWYPNDFYHVKEMHESLRRLNRDVVYSLSGIVLYANAPVWAQYTNCYRTTGDIFDNWNSMKSIGFDQQAHWTGFNGPGHWADPDMLIVGMVGWGDKLHYTNLTPDEQFTHISAWALLAAPMLIGCDIEHMDDFTLSLLCNREVNDIDQDPLGLQAYPVQVDGYRQTWVKQLENGSMAVGLFNLGTLTDTLSFKPRDFGIYGQQTIRDVWRQKDVATIKDTESFQSEVAPHGCRLLIVGPGNSRQRMFKRP